METMQLRYFLAVADHRSFTRGAEAAGISQPSISQQIGKLETELGSPLFHRLGKTVELTEVGRELVPRARDILNSLADLASVVPAVTGDVGGKLRIGTVPTIAQCMLPPLLRSFLSEYPNVELTLHEDDRHTLMQQILDGTLDIAVLSRFVHHDRMDSTPLLDEDFVLAVPRAHRLIERRQIKVEDVRDERLVLLDQGAGLPNLILDFLQSHHINPVIACRTSQLATVQAMVAAGLGIAFVPKMATVESDDRPCVYRTLTGARPKRTISLVRHRKRFLSPAAREFIQRLRALSGSSVKSR
jgi:LysR family hydrogen peroxide-inducible transcriptional activator